MSASEDWLPCVMQRNVDIAPRKPRRLSRERARGWSGALADYFAVCVRHWTSVPNRLLFSVRSGLSC
jgi:hypothetical protein